jgi:SAM-dependent methyltransferase
LAPEGVLYRRIRSAIGTGYMPADARPEAYYSIDCVKMMLPDGLAMFPDGYFDFIIHNHVLEHIPGSFRDHLTEIHRVVRPGGYHIFSVPGPRISKETEEGGEHLTAEERMARFGQIDHLKMFGPDLPAFLEAFPGGTFGWDGLSDDKRAELNVRPKSNVFWSGIRAKPSSGS